MTVIKVATNQIFIKKALLSRKPIWCYSFLLFHSYNPKQKGNHQMASSRAKARSTQSQTCMKYRNISIFNKIWKYFKKMSKKGWFSRRYLQFLQSFAFNFMHDWRAVTKKSVSLIVSTVLWLLFSCNTLSVTHSDTALYALRPVFFYFFILNLV